MTHSISMGADDMGFLLQAVPGVYAWIGNGSTSAALHQPDYDFNDNILAKGSDFLADIARHFLSLHP